MSGDTVPGGVWDGVVEMTDDRYQIFAALDGRHLLVSRPYPAPIGERTAGEPKAIYVAVNRSGHACYAGQTKPGDGVRECGFRPDVPTPVLDFQAGGVGGLLGHPAGRRDSARDGQPA